MQLPVSRVFPAIAQPFELDASWNPMDMPGVSSMSRTLRSPSASPLCTHDFLPKSCFWFCDPPKQGLGCKVPPFLLGSSSGLPETFASHPLSDISSNHVMKGLNLALLVGKADSLCPPKSDICWGLEQYSHGFSISLQC